MNDFDVVLYSGHSSAVGGTEQGRVVEVKFLLNMTNQMVQHQAASG